MEMLNIMRWDAISFYCAITMLIIAYVLGSIPSAVWIGKKYYGIDIREHGSKNAGTTNMLRVLGKKAALPVFALDFFKGFVAVILINLLHADIHISDAWLTNLKIMAVFAAVLGHIFPVFANFKGGKGVATMVGAVMGINPPVVLLCFAIWTVVFIVSHYVSLASMTAGCSFPVLVLISQSTRWMRTGDVSLTYVIFSFVVAGLLIWTHRKNISRLRNRTESKIYIWQKPDEDPTECGRKCDDKETTEETGQKQE